MSEVKFRFPTGGMLVTLVVLLSISTIACSGSSSSASSNSKDDETALRARVQAFWECRLKDDARSQYDLWDPQFKKKCTLDEFQNMQGSTKYLGYQIKNVTVNGDSAVVAVEYQHKLGIVVANLDPKPMTDVFEMNWVRSDGAWYFKCPENPLNPTRTPAAPQTKSETPADNDGDKVGKTRK